MKLQLRIYGVLFLLACGLFACNREYDPTPDYLDQIYPIQEGKYRIYHVTDTIFETSSSQLFEALTYYKRELTEGTETDLLGREVNKLRIDVSPDTLGTLDNPSYAWSFSELWTQFADDDFYEQTEGNTRYLVMRNPPYLGSTWDGNLYNNNGPRIYEFTQLDTSLTLFGNTYPNCVFVQQQEFYKPVSDSTGPIFLIEHAYEIYAPGIGKVVKYSKFLEAQDGVFEPDSRILLEVLVDHNYDL